MPAQAGPSRAECVAVIRDLVAFPTVSRDPNRDLIAYVKAFLDRHGVESELVWNAERTKANLWATIGPANRPGVVLSGHSDVVPVDGQDWSSDSFTLREADGRLYGRGTCDMKGFVGIMLAFVPFLVRRDLKAPVHFAISYDEELGCIGVQSLIDRLAALPVKPKLCIVGEPTSMQVVVGHKGAGFYRVALSGRSAHSSLAPAAVNAVEYAAEIICIIGEMAREQRVSGLRDDGYDVPYSTLSVTTVAGGNAANIIPAECAFQFDIRALPAVDTRELIGRLEERIEREILPRMRAVSPQSSVTIEPVAELAGFDTDAVHPAVTFVKQLVGRNDHGKVAYGTEAGLFSKAGIVSIVCGPGSIEQAHKPDEYLELTEVDRCRNVLQRLLLHLERAELPW
ncbi:acetylornithine deacetylase [Kumtagia ephedrae]|uniref:Acetylornithine deacetylase n=1 Tax=Kumtagia ephedrae TaxID=2116701 RepID=A0A2P7RVG9_9HYPH|nr:acetylornithine deacetylase [Mesorhizobium ephedrae]PSJ54201.1 acetylornithine deacetylase [Mesorhizobium ephedrae]